MPRRAATPGSRALIGRSAAGTSAVAGRVALVTVLLGTLLLGLALPGCSAKPTRKKGRSKAAAARAREEKTLVDGAPERSGPVDAPPAGPSGDGDMPAAVEGAATPDSEAGAENAVPPAAPPEVAAGDDETAPAVPTLADAPTGPSAGSERRPASPLVDPDTAIALDGGRVEVSSPKGWARSPRSQSYLVRYQPTPRQAIPSIVVTVEPAPEGLGTVTRKNQADLVAAITARLAVDFPAGGTVKVIKKPAAVTLGPHAGVAWAVPGSAKIDGLTETIDRFAWGVVLAGRLYVVEARGPRGKLDDAARDRAKAVAATLFRPADAPEGNPGSAAEVPAATEAAPAE